MNVISFKTFANLLNIAEGIDIDTEQGFTGR